MHSNQNLSLRDLEATPLPRPHLKTYVSEKCANLWDIPLSSLSPQDVRLLIGQALGVRHLIPLAIQILRDNPFTEIEFYPGDLLLVVLRCAQSHQKDCSEFMPDIHAIANSGRQQLDCNYTSADVPMEVRSEIDTFLPSS